MPVTYNSIEKITDPPDLPAWHLRWPGYDGCGYKDFDYFSPIAVTKAPTNFQYFYEPEAVREFRDQRRFNGFRRGAYPPYRYTPRSMSRIVTRNHLLRRLNASDGQNVYYPYGNVSKVNNTCTPCLSYLEQTGERYSSWYEVTHSMTASEYTVSAFNPSDVSNAVQAVQNDASTEALTSYDFLTEAAEAREIPGLLRSIATDLYKVLQRLGSHYSRSDLRTAARLSPLQLLKNPRRALRKLGSEWMAYRYGIMPLVYSYRDLVKLTNRGTNVKTRKTVVVSPRATGVALPGPTTRYKWKESVGSITVSANIFQHFSWQAMAMLAGVGFNPLVTAWELIPYSFVIDWFVDVGSYITRKTSQPVAREYWACISQRHKYTIKTWAHFANENKTITFANRTPTGWYMAQPPALPSRLINRPEESQILREEIYDEYYRDLFLVSAAQLQINPNLNWRRLIDAAVMTFNQLSGLNRRFRG